MSKTPRVDPGRLAMLSTDIKVRALFPDNSYGNADISMLDRASLWRWLRSRGGDNRWAEGVVLLLLEHEPLKEGESPYENEQP